MQIFRPGCGLSGGRCWPQLVGGSVRLEESEAVINSRDPAADGAAEQAARPTAVAPGGEVIDAPPVCFLARDSLYKN